MNKVLIFDIETAPIQAYVWDLKDQNIALNQIKQDWAVIAWSAKWLNDPPSKILYYDQRNSKDPYDDKKILIPLWKLLDEADIVITQNGQRFDSPKLNARFIYHGMQPPSSYRHLDTYQLIRKTALFTSNRLEYLTDKLCVKYKKITHGKYPGMKLWVECLKGNIDAWNEMKRYNIHDVLSTEEFYLKIRAWVPETAPHVYDIGKEDRKCHVCGKIAMQSKGVKATLKYKYRRLQCKNCGTCRSGERIDG